MSSRLARAMKRPCPNKGGPGRNCSRLTEIRTCWLRAHSPSSLFQASHANSSHFLSRVSDPNRLRRLALRDPPWWVSFLWTGRKGSGTLTLWALLPVQLCGISLAAYSCDCRKEHFSSGSPLSLLASSLFLPLPISTKDSLSPGP